MDDELVERVARAVHKLQTLDGNMPWNDQIAIFEETCELIKDLHGTIEYDAETIRFLKQEVEELAAVRPVIRAEALEEAAKVADAAVTNQWQGRKIAAAIRALKEKSST